MKPLLSQNVTKRFSGKRTARGFEHCYSYKRYAIQVDGYAVYLMSVPSVYDSIGSTLSKIDAGVKYDRTILGTITRDGFVPAKGDRGELAAIALSEICNTPIEVIWTRASAIVEKHYRATMLSQKTKVSSGIRTHNNLERKRDRPKHKPIIR